MRARLLVALSSLLLAAAPARALNPIQPPAPEFPDNSVWINAKPLTLARLKHRRVVVLAFIDVSNLNSRRALKTLSLWHETYQSKGVMVIGVHTPVYGFERDPALLRAQIRKLGVDFPVILDNDRKVWDAYQNEGWPALYLIDSHGRIGFSLLGEQRYEEFEGNLRETAEALGYKMGGGKPVAEDPPNRDCGYASPERATVGKNMAIALRKTQTEDNDDDTGIPEVQTGPNMIGVAREGELAKKGEWKLDAASLRLGEPNRELESFLRVIYRGTQAFAVLAPPPGKKTRIYVKQDDLWLHAGNASSNVEFDDDGRSYVVVDQPGLYQLTQNPNDIFHALVVLPEREGAAVYSFSYADQCLRYAP